MKLWETNQSLFNVTAQSTIKTKLCAVVIHAVHWIFSLQYIYSNFSVVKVLRDIITAQFQVPLYCVFHLLRAVANFLLLLRFNTSK